MSFFRLLRHVSVNRKLRFKNFMINLRNFKINSTKRSFGPIPDIVILIPKIFNRFSNYVWELRNVFKISLSKNSDHICVNIYITYFLEFSFIHFTIQVNTGVKF